MREFIKFVMSKGDPITLPMELAEKLIDKESQLLKIPDKNGNWTGQVINKAHIISTDHDTDKERIEAENDRMLIPKIEEVRNDRNTKKEIEKLRDNLKKQKVIK